MCLAVIQLPSCDLWVLAEALRWGFHKSKLTDIDGTKKIIDRVYREALGREVANGIFNGIKSEPENPAAYLNSLKILKIKAI